MGIDSICILRECAGLELKKSAMRDQERKAMPTATIVEMKGRFMVCLAAARKLMGMWLIGALHLRNAENNKDIL